MALSEAHAYALEALHELDYDPETNELYLFEHTGYVGHEESEGSPGVEFAMASKFIKNINFAAKRTTKPILIHMKTGGGYVNHGMAIYDAIRACPNRTAILAYGETSSMSSLILQAATRRIFLPNTTFMAHDGSEAYEGTTKQFLAYSEFAKRQLPKFADIFVERLKESEEFADQSDGQIRAWLKRKFDSREELYLDAKEALKWGFIDEILGVTIDRDQLLKGL